MCGVIFLLLRRQSDIPRFAMAIFDLDDYRRQPNFSNHIIGRAATEK